jgi:hypothetical protein
MIHHHRTSAYHYAHTTGPSRAMGALVIIALLVLILAIAAALTPWRTSSTSTPVQPNQPAQQLPVQQPGAPIGPNEPLLPREQQPSVAPPALLPPSPY